MGFYACKATARSWVCVPASRQQNVYWVQLYEVAYVGIVLEANRVKTIETLKKRKNWKGWLGVGLYVGRNKYVEVDLYSDGRVAVPRDDGMVQAVVSWLSSVLFTC